MRAIQPFKSLRVGWILVLKETHFTVQFIRRKQGFNLEAPRQAGRHVVVIIARKKRKRKTPCAWFIFIIFFSCGHTDWKERDDFRFLKTWNIWPYIELAFSFYAHISFNSFKASCQFIGSFIFLIFIVFKLLPLLLVGVEWSTQGGTTLPSTRRGTKTCHAVVKSEKTFSTAAYCCLMTVMFLMTIMFLTF